MMTFFSSLRSLWRSRACCFSRSASRRSSRASTFFFFFEQKTAYEISVRDWSSDVCSSDLLWSDVPGQAMMLLTADCLPVAIARRSEERRVGKECERLCRSRRSSYNLKKKKRSIGAELTVSIIYVEILCIGKL